MSKQKRILLVEDNRQDVELTLAALAEQNLAVEVAVVEDGVEALEYLQRRGKFADRPGGNPAVVLLDIKMPRLNGLEVLERMKADSALNTIPVVMLTSSREESDLARAYRLGVNAYVVKPVDYNRFANAVRILGAFWTQFNEAPSA